MNKVLFRVFIVVTLLTANSECLLAHEFEDLGVLVRHKGNKISLIAAPNLANFRADDYGNNIKFDRNNDGKISNQEVQTFENEIANRIQNLVTFTDEQGRKAIIQSVRLKEKGYENLLKITGPDDNTNSNRSLENKNENEVTYIQLSLKFQWDSQPQAIYLYYGLLTNGKKNVLVRNQNIGKSHIQVLQSTQPTTMIFPATSKDSKADNNSYANINSNVIFTNVANSTVTNTVTKAIWVLGVEHVIAGFDHILFILALILVCKSATKLIVPLSAFTLTHSLALVLVAFGVELKGLSSIIEASIALTIVIMALIELRGWQPKRLYLMTAIMGVIHGFGLGQALSDNIGGVEGWALVLVQVTFGVELAQLAIAVIFLGALHMASIQTLIDRKALEINIMHLVLCVALFWMFERL